MPVLIRLGEAADIEAAVSVYERSNLARHQGVWPSRAAAIEHVNAHLSDPATWFLVAIDGLALVLFAWTGYNATTAKYQP